jgi:GxxExxY protein
LQKLQLDFCTKVALPLRYEDLVIPRAYEPDIVVAGCLIVEAKACESLADIHVRQIDTYLRLSGCPLGLLVNFGAARVLDGIVRRVNNFPHGTAPYSDREVTP